MADRSRLVVVVVYPGVQMLDVVGPTEVFAAASSLAGPRRPGYRRLIASLDGRPVRSDSGLRLEADVALPELHEPVDTLMVAGGWGITEAVAPDLVAEVTRVAATARRVCSVCSGALTLAAAGLLAGRSATTHWAACSELARRHPDIRVQPDRIFVRDGNVFTSAGASAGMDLALALVEADHGAETARQVARWLVLFLHRPGGQSQFSERLSYQVASDSPLRAVLDTIVADPAADHRVPRLAERAAMSDRHLTRLFVEQTGCTPARFVERIRVEAARELLERGSLPIESVAVRSGFGSDETLRRAFLRVIGVGPNDYRDRFRSTSTPSTDIGQHLSPTG